MTEDAFRCGYRECRALLLDRLSAKAPARIQLLAGPRQVGKTTLLLELVEHFGKSAIYAAADGPEAALPGFWERIWASAERVAESTGHATLLLDEAHLLHDWAARLKGEWDRIRRLELPLHVVATGSSALHLGMGSRESLAGRFERVTLTHWNAASLAEVFHIPRPEAARLVVRQGAYPGAFEYRESSARWAAYVRDAIVEPAIGRDLLALAPVRKPALLRQVFGVCAASPTEIVSLQKIRGQLQDSGALETIAHYLGLLEEAFLVAPLEKYSPRPVRRRAAPPKLVPLSNAFLAVTDPRGIPEPGQDPARFGAWVENACLAHAWNSGQRVSYWREEPLEVDGILEGSWGKWAIEVKAGTFSAADLKGLAELTRRNPSFRPLVVCDANGRTVAARAGFEAMSWTDFLLGDLEHGLQPFTRLS